jgi:threonine/homoserine/homoserine lactone efflux protein
MLAFLFTALVVEITPGPNMGTLALITLERGRRAGFAAVAGVALGLAVIGLVAALGLAALVSETPAVYQTLRWAGVVYLLFLAFSAWRDAGRGGDITQASGTAWSQFVRGLVLNVLNPKAAIFYIAILPTFIDLKRGSVVTQNLVLVAAYVAVATFVHSGVVVLAARLRPLLVSGTSERLLRRALAGVMVLIAGWLAWETR